MQSQHGDKFNHDGWEAIYDKDVADETHPIRAGYDACLNWVAERAAVTADETAVDLGIGTGNLAARIGGAKLLIGVDLSNAMMRVAESKLDHHTTVAYVESDLLAYFDDDIKADVVVSTYAVHHLTEPEKALLFERIDRALPIGGRAVFGDLAFESATARSEAKQRYLAAGRKDVAFDIDDEFFWLLDGCVAKMQSLGWHVEIKRFSDLSWGVAATKR